MENHKNDLELNCIKIKNYLSKNNGTFVSEISNDLSLNKTYLLNLLNIWERYWNTYFEFGRIFSTKVDNVIERKWFWISNKHHLARQQKLFYHTDAISESFLYNKSPPETLNA